MVKQYITIDMIHLPCEHNFTVKVINICISDHSSISSRIPIDSRLDATQVISSINPPVTKDNISTCACRVS